MQEDREGPTAKRSYGGRSGYRERSAAPAATLLCLGFIRQALHGNAAPLNNPAPLTSAQWSSHYVASESSNAVEAADLRFSSFSSLAFSYSVSTIPPHPPPSRLVPSCLRLPRSSCRVGFSSETRVKRSPFRRNLGPVRCMLRYRDLLCASNTRDRETVKNSCTTLLYLITRIDISLL